MINKRYKVLQSVKKNNTINNMATHKSYKYNLLAELI